MPYYVSIKAYNSTVQEFCAVGFMGVSAQSLHICWLYQRVESYIRLAISETRVVYTSGYIRKSSRIYNWLYQRVKSYIQLAISESSRISARMRAQNKMACNREEVRWGWVLVEDFFWLYQKVESYIQLAISESQVIYTTGYIRESSRIYDWLYQSRVVSALECVHKIKWCTTGRKCGGGGY